MKNNQISLFPLFTTKRKVVPLVNHPILSSSLRLPLKHPQLQNLPIILDPIDRLSMVNELQWRSTFLLI